MSTIVVIEEDVAMRALICEWLKDAGYAVRALPAVGASSDDGADVGLVIVDVLHLRSQGAGTVRRAQDLYPRAALIGLSTQLGRSLGSDSDPARTLGVRHLIAKPCTRSELLGAVADTIGPAPA